MSEEDDLLAMELRASSGDPNLEDMAIEAAPLKILIRMDCYLKSLLTV